MKSIGRGRRLSAVGIALATAAATVLVGVPASAAHSSPDEDEIISSPNMTQVAHVPPTAPLAGDGSVGTDIAFQGRYAFVGNYLGFTIYDIKHPNKPKVISQVLCPGGQNDVSITGDLLFLSTDSRRSDDSCTSESQPDGSKPHWEGIKIFDVSKKRKPEYVQSVETACGSHTHTLVPDKAGEVAYLYVSSYSPSESLPNCQPPHDKISIVQVPLDDPTAASVAATPVMFPDGGLPGNGEGINTPGGVATSGCHDITVYPEKDLAAGSCMGDGVLWDISNRVNPVEIDRVQDDEHFAFWHSATFNNDATTVVFTDELGGGGSATCNEEIGPENGADGIYDITGTGADRKLEFRTFFKIDRMQTDEENCVAHNGSLIPVQGKDIMVQSWYMGGIQVWDFTDSANPRKIGFWERGPATDPSTGGGSWSAYYYNGYIYSSDLGKGLDVLAIDDPITDPAFDVVLDELNAQTQYRYGS